MAKALSLDIRRRIVAHVKNGNSARSAAARFSVSQSCAIRIVKRWRETGSIAPLPAGGRRFSKMEAVGDYLIGRVLEEPDVTLFELQAELANMGVEVHHTSISAFLRKEGFSYKKNADGKRTRQSRCDASAC